MIFISVFTNFESFIPYNRIHLFAVYLITQNISPFFSNFEIFHQKIDKIKHVFKNNSHSKIFLDISIKKYLYKVFIKIKVFPEP